MKKHNLEDYKNLCDWAIRAYALEDTLASQKDAVLAEVNRKLGTNYQRNHIDNWLAERVPTPKRVRGLWIDHLIEVEVEFEYSKLGKQLRRLIKARQSIN